MFRDLPSDVAALLDLQHGVATSAQLQAVGLTHRRCALAVRRGLLLRPYRGVYVDRAAWRSTSEVSRNAMRLLATQLIAPDAVGIGTTAAMIWQLPVRRAPDRAEVARSIERGRLTGALVRRAQVVPEDVIEVEGLVVTTIPATCAAIAGSTELPDALITLDAAVRRGIATANMLAAAVRLPRATQRRRAERTIGWADPWSESWLESLSRGQAIEVGMPAPLCNVTLLADGREVRVDKLWADSCVVGEADGKGKYERRSDVAEAHWQEKQRHDWLVDLGFEVARWGAQHAGGDGSAMVQRVRRAFARRARVGTEWPDGVRAEIRALPGVETPSRVVNEVARLQALGVPIGFASPDLWRPAERPRSLWTPPPSRDAA